MAWLVSLGITQVRALDAARETARAAARSDGSGQASPSDDGSPRQGRGSRVSRGDGTVVREVSSPVNGPGGPVRPLGHLPGRGRGRRGPGAGRGERSWKSRTRRAGSRVRPRRGDDRAARDGHRRHVRRGGRGRHPPACPVGRRPGRPRRRLGAAGRRRRCSRPAPSPAQRRRLQRCQVDGSEVVVVVARSVRLPGLPMELRARGSRRARCRTRPGQWHGSGLVAVRARPRARRACTRRACCSAR